MKFWGGIFLIFVCLFFSVPAHGKETSKLPETLEEVYDPREFGKVTPVRSQKSNVCWAFSSLAAGEQSLLYKGLADSAVDLSEAHLAYFFYHAKEDPLGNANGDGNQNISAKDFLAAGSNTVFSTFALAGWVGAAEESEVPLDSLTRETVYDKSLAYADKAHLQNAFWIHFKEAEEGDAVKRMIKKYGAAAVNFYWNCSYYERENNAYYFTLDSSRPNNHSAVIVGWDDTFPRENFKEENRPEHSGAWIIKNSYGKEWGDGGYFYLSYEDSAVNSRNANENRARAYIFDFEPADNYDYNYQYDGSAGAYNVTNRKSKLTKVDSKGAIANVFEVHNKDGFESEILKAVSFALFDTSVFYSIQIYKNLSDASNPVSGTPQLVSPERGSVRYAGYYTIPLDSPVELRDGENFSVVVTLEKEDGGQVEFFADKTYRNGNWVMFTNTVKEKESFRFLDGQWEDMAENGITARIKAFTAASDRAADVFEDGGIFWPGMFCFALLFLWKGCRDF